jgi:hypothetical protein
MLNHLTVEIVRRGGARRAEYCHSCRVSIERCPRVGRTSVHAKELRKCSLSVIESRPKKLAQGDSPIVRRWFPWKRSSELGSKHS